MDCSLVRAAIVENSGNTFTTFFTGNETMRRRIFGAHQLAFGATYKPGDGERLSHAVKTSKQAGCALFEITCTALMQMPAEQTATAVLAGGIDEVAYCLFFPGGDGSNPPPMGDPLGDTRAQVDAAVATFQSGVDYINALRDNGLKVRYITGPNGFVLGQNYGQPRNTVRDRFRQYYDKIGKIIDGQGLTVALEYLRPGEDEGAIGSAAELVHLLDLIGNDNIGAHADTFHMRQRRETPHKIIELMGKWLKYVHAHGDMRSVPGTFQIDGFTDEINWYLFGQALTAVGYEGPVVAEPFGQATRDEIPPLGVGLPPAIEARVFYDKTFSHFEQMGVLTF